MKKISAKFNNLSLRSKLIWSYFVIAFAPFLIFSILSTMMYYKQVENNISEHTNQMLGQVKTAIEVYIKSLEKLSNYVIKEIQNNSSLKQGYILDSIRTEESRNISDMLYNIANSHPEVAGILIATNQDKYISTGMTRISRDSFTQEDWYQKAINAPKETHIISNVAGRNIVTNQSYSVDDVFSISKAIVNPDTQEILGVILMDIRHDIISSSIESITIGQKGFVFVMDDYNHIVYTPVNKITYRVDPKWLLTDKKKPITTQIRNEKYQIRSEKSEYTNWNIVGVFSLDEIMGKAYSIIYILFGFLCLILICVIVISMKISQSITKPVVKLKEAMKEAESGDFTVRFQVNQEDEISELGRNFNFMLQRIEELVQLVYMEQKNKRTAELKALQEQIKPHFLYNTLDTINWMAREYEADDIVRLVEALTNMFRIGLSQGKDYICVSEEIKYVSNYLYIQKIRYRSKLNYRVIDEDDIQDYIIPKFVLQPLVENAIYHGIKAKRGEGNLIIEVREIEETRMELSVSDDGVGMDENKVKELNILLNQQARLNKKQSFGLYYVEERLRLRYGTDFKVTVTSKRGEGTKISIVIPKKAAIIDEEE